MALNHNWKTSQGGEFRTEEFRRWITESKVGAIGDVDQFVYDCDDHGWPLILMELSVADRKSKERPHAMEPGAVSPTKEFFHKVDVKLISTRGQGQLYRCLAKMADAAVLNVVYISQELHTAGLWVKPLRVPCESPFISREWQPSVGVAGMTDTDFLIRLQQLRTAMLHYSRESRLKIVVTVQEVVRLIGYDNVIEFLKQENKVPETDISSRDLTPPLYRLVKACLRLTGSTDGKDYDAERRARTDCDLLPTRPSTALTGDGRSLPVDESVSAAIRLNR